jgi:glutathione S-transferase
MKLTFSPASPFARKVRIAAIETGLIDKIEFTPATVAPGQPNEEYSKITPLKKLPVLILDNGDVILDSYVIVEYLDELAGGGKLIPTSGPDRWKVKSDHSLLQGMLDSMLLCRYEAMVRPEPLRWQAWSDDHWKRAWAGMARGSRTSPRSCRGRSISYRSASSVCSAMPISALPIAAGARPIRSWTPSIRRCWSGLR